jgi:hypothetical protein
MAFYFDCPALQQSLLDHFAAKQLLAECGMTREIDLPASPPVKRSWWTRLLETLSLAHSR